ncbi:class I glutamine amidotransferase-like protein [Parathielavia appendiculata]|uniref:Class I glutamine amidotransferase-like protein n=1 Tax=Parathielavia appendiculata TaxID=2587402 RepID=A0AAN6Z993_9PEZI|nr:class I glutamine amidotransferase-like protein [Parathielavia appendiculata]
MTSSSPKKLRIGVMLEAVQLSDILGIDILGNLSKDYMSQVKDLQPAYAAFESHAIDMEFFYIATTLEPGFMTPGLHFVPTVTYEDCPRDLDIVLIGGPLLSHRPEQAARFMREAWPKTRVWLTTCIGSMWLASSGVLDGLKCTTNRECLGLARKMHPEVEWLDQRWVIQDKVFEGESKGELWTAGGAGAGIHMVATYCLENFDRKFVKTLALGPLEFRLDGNVSQFYLA